MSLTQNPYLDWLLRGHIFISLCAVCMSIETCLTLDAPLPPISVMWLLFFSTLFSYNIYYVRTPEKMFYGLLSLIGALGAFVSWMMIPFSYHFMFLVIAAASVLYILPVFLPFPKPDSFALQKLVLLICIWVLSTFFLPLEKFVLTERNLILLSYRFVFLSLLCLLFFIRDEKKEILRSRANVAYQIFLGIQLLFSSYFCCQQQWALGLSYGSITILLFFISRSLQKQKPGVFFYLGLVDGMMCLQFIFVSLSYFLFS
jgi:hypothetical protein